MQEGGRRGFSLLELLVVMAIIGILASLLLPTLSQVQARAKQIKCVHQLRELGIAFHGFAHDHGSGFPMGVSSSAGGSAEFIQNSRKVAANEFYFSYRHFQALSNELGSTRVLVCPADNRVPTLSFPALKNENLSYFAGVDASYDRPGSLLAGDRNIEVDGQNSQTSVRPTAATPLRWTAALHQFRGNLLYADAHVEQTRGPVSRRASGELHLPTVKGWIDRAPATTVARGPSRSVASVAAPQPAPRTHAIPPQALPRPNFEFRTKRLDEMRAEARQPLPAQKAEISSPSVATMAAPSRSGATTEEPKARSGFKMPALLWLLLLLLLVLAAVVVRAWMQYWERMPKNHRSRSWARAPGLR